MATIVRGTVPAGEFALSRTLDTVPNLEFEIERVVESGEETVMPLLWVRGADEQRVAEALAADPSIDEMELLAAFDTEWLYRMEWIDQVDLLLRMVDRPGGPAVADGHQPRRHRA